MKLRQLILTSAAIALLACSLSGCVVVPAHPYYGPPPHYYDHRW